jgi:C4-type Zn-finger protein
MNNKRTRTRRSQLACPQCGIHLVGVRQTVPIGDRIIERYRFCEACQQISKTREVIVFDYQEYAKAVTAKNL